jgi:hypothetical protein
MKTTLVFLAACLFTISTSAQGTLNFNNRTQSGDAPIILGTGRGAGSVPGFTAQLYLVKPGGILEPLYPTTTFRTTSEAAMYFVKAINPFVVDGVLPGQPATFRLRVYQGSSYESARTNTCLHFGESNDVTVPQLGGTLQNGTVIPTPSLDGLQWFGMILSSIEPLFIIFESISSENDTLRFDLAMNLQNVPTACWTNFVLEASQDLISWLPPILTNPPPTFTIPYNQETQRNRFFRLRTIP